MEQKLVASEENRSVARIEAKVHGAKSVPGLFKLVEALLVQKSELLLKQRTDFLERGFRHEAPVPLRKVGHQLFNGAEHCRTKEKTHRFAHRSHDG